MAQMSTCTSVQPSSFSQHFTVKGALLSQVPIGLFRCLEAGARDMLTQDTPADQQGKEDVGTDTTHHFHAVDETGPLCSYPMERHCYQTTARHKDQDTQFPMGSNWPVSWGHLLWKMGH